MGIPAARIGASSASQRRQWGQVSRRHEIPGVEHEVGAERYHLFDDRGAPAPPRPRIEASRAVEARSIPR